MHALIHHLSHRFALDADRRQRLWALSGLHRPPDRLGVLDGDKVLVAQPDKRIGAGHGSFDNDVDVVARTLGRIVGAPLVAPPDDLRGF